MRANYLTEKIMRMTKRTIWALQQQLKKGDFEPVGYEVRFTTELENQQMHLSYGDRGVMSLNGKIDRMDLCEEDDKVLSEDYRLQVRTYKVSIWHLSSWAAACS